MKTHSQNSPQTVRGLRNRRSPRATLDTRWQQEADIRTAEYVGPFGKGFHKVKNPGGETEYIVADSTGGRTFAPGTAVKLGSDSGTAGETLLGGPPPGKQGGGKRTNARRRRGTAAVESNQYAFGNDGSDLSAMLYSDGTYVSTRLTITIPSETVCGIILTDTSLLVGDGSALLSNLEDSIKVWDVEGATMYTHTVAAGWVLAAWPVYYDEAVYWLEIEDDSTFSGHAQATMGIRIRTAATDLTGVATAATATLDATEYDHGNGTDHYDPDAFVAGSFMVDADGAVAYLKVFHNEPGHGVVQSQHYQFRFALPGGSETHREYDMDTYPIEGRFCATLASGTFIAAADDSILEKTDDASAEATVLDSGLEGYSASINIAPNGTTRQVCNATGPALDRIYRNGSLVASAIDAFNGTNYPTQMFYFGEG